MIFIQSICKLLQYSSTEPNDRHRKPHLAIPTSAYRYERTDLSASSCQVSLPRFRDAPQCIQRTVLQIDHSHRYPACHTRDSHKRTPFLSHVMTGHVLVLCSLFAKVKIQQAACPTQQPASSLPRKTLLSRTNMHTGSRKDFHAHTLTEHPDCSFEGPDPSHKQYTKYLTCDGRESLTHATFGRQSQTT